MGAGVMARRALSRMMRQRLGGEIALMHALCTIFARRAAILVDALGLALTAADAGTTRPQGRGPNDASGGRHVSLKLLCCRIQLC